MKKTISKNIGGLMLIATIALVITSCQKEQNASLKSNSSDAVSSISTCAPIPDSLRVPAGNKLLLQAFARGVQIYQVKRSAADPNVFLWVNIAPLATLYTKPNF